MHNLSTYLSVWLLTYLYLHVFISAKSSWPTWFNSLRIGEQREFLRTYEHWKYKPTCTKLHQSVIHDDVIKWKHFPRYWPFVREIHRSPVNFPHKGQWRGALMFSLICTRMNGWVNNREAGDLRRYQVHYDVIVMFWLFFVWRTQMSTDYSYSAYEREIDTTEGQGPVSYKDSLSQIWGFPCCETVLSLTWGSLY